MVDLTTNVHFICMVSSIIRTIFIQDCREHVNVAGLACLKLGPAREWKHDTSIAHQNGKGCLSVAYSKTVAVQLTWAAVWWLVEPGSWLAVPKEGSFLLLCRSPNPSRGQLCSVIRDKARGKRVIFLAIFKLHHFTKWSNKTQHKLRGCVSNCKNWSRQEQGAFDFLAGWYTDSAGCSKPLC